MEGESGLALCHAGVASRPLDQNAVDTAAGEELACVAAVHSPAADLRSPVACIDHLEAVAGIDRVP